MMNFGAKIEFYLKISMWTLFQQPLQLQLQITFLLPTIRIIISMMMTRWELCNFLESSATKVFSILSGMATASKQWRPKNQDWIRNVPHWSSHVRRLSVRLLGNRFWNIFMEILWQRHSPSHHKFGSTDASKVPFWQPHHCSWIPCQVGGGQW